MSPEDCFPAGWRVLAFDAIGSTNAEAMRQAAAGERGPLWITARHQTGGRGRSGRTWASAGASLAATLLIAPRCPATALPQLSLVAGVAGYDAVAAALPEAARPLVRLKWPNDVLIGVAKVSGILVESSIFGEQAVVAIGTGINIEAAPCIAGREITSIGAHGANADFARLSAALARSLAHWLEIWADSAGFERIRQAWLARGGPLGVPMTVNADGEQAAGRYAGLDGDGGLLLSIGPGELRKFSFGDVALGVTRV